MSGLGLVLLASCQVRELSPALRHQEISASPWTRNASIVNVAPDAASSPAGSTISRAILHACSLVKIPCTLGCR